jgi:hypothetical protein
MAGQNHEERGCMILSRHDSVLSGMLTAEREPTGRKTEFFQADPRTAQRTRLRRRSRFLQPAS